MSSTFAEDEEDSEGKKAMSDKNEDVVGDPRVGDVWKDLDPRASGRQIEILQDLPDAGVAMVQRPGGESMLPEARS